MESTTTIESFPVFTAEITSPVKGKSSKKPGKATTVTSAALSVAEPEVVVLSKVNRTLICKFCGSDKILNPRQYQALYDGYDANEESIPDRIAEDFMCKPCEMSMRRNPLKFWTIYGDAYQVLSRNLRSIFDVYKESGRSADDAVRMQTATENLMRGAFISNSLYEYVIKGSLPVAMAIKDIPYVGTVVLWVYESRKNRIQLQK